MGYCLSNTLANGSSNVTNVPWRVNYNHTKWYTSFLYRVTVGFTCNVLPRLQVSFVHHFISLQYAVAYSTKQVLYWPVLVFHWNWNNHAIAADALRLDCNTKTHYIILHHCCFWNILCVCRCPKQWWWNYMKILILIFLTTFCLYRVCYIYVILWQSLTFKYAAPDTFASHFTSLHQIKRINYHHRFYGDHYLFSPL